MKKIIFFIISILIFQITQAQDTDISFDKKKYPLDDNQKLTYSLIKEVPNATKDELYNRALAWIAESFKENPADIKLKDKDAGKIVVHGSSEDKYTAKTLGVMVPKKYYQNVKMEFSIKEGKYRLIITDFTIENIAARLGSSYVPSSTHPIEKYYKQIPDSYDFSKLTSLGRTQLFSSKTILIKADKFAKATLASAKSYMAKPIVHTEKEIW